MEDPIAYLPYCTPYRFDLLLDFFRLRELEGVEVVGPDFYLRTARIALPDGTEARGWVRVEDDPSRQALVVRTSPSLACALPQVSERIRHQFDTESNPHAVHDALAPLDDVIPGANVAGTRIPGCFDAFETAMRAVLGQQVTVVAANKLAARIADAYGTPVVPAAQKTRADATAPTAQAAPKGTAASATPLPAADSESIPYPEGLAHFFPTAADVLALDPIEDALGVLGVIKTRSRCIAEIARLVDEGELDLRPGADAHEQMRRLLAIKGIGPWSTNYLAMRTLGYPDAFLETDAGVKHALPGRAPKQILELAEQWRPYRSYATVCLWNSLA